MLCIGGRKRRNKVIVGEPAIGSLLVSDKYLSLYIVTEIIEGTKKKIIMENSLA